MNSAYAQFVKSRAKKMGTAASDILHAIVGVSSEAGEALDVVKKHWAYCQPLDTVHLREELGDILFYVQHACNLLDITFADLTAENITKLEKRYPTGYTDEAAAARADKESPIANGEQQKSRLIFTKPEPKE